MQPNQENPPGQHDRQESESGRAQERDIAAHIFSASAVLLGLCLTIISVVRGNSQPDRLETVVDDILAVDGLIFLVACFLSYAGMRARHLRRMHKVESVADAAFLLGMAGLGLASVLLVWTVL